MYPVIEILGKQIGTYLLLALAGAFLAGTIFCVLINKRGLNDNQAIAFLLFAALGALVGSHILYAVVNYKYIPALLNSNSLQEFGNNLMLWIGGAVFYGGLIGAAVAGGITIKVMHLNRQVYLDCVAPIAPLFHAIARVGCFFAGCCYGIESGVGFTVHHNPFVPEINGVCRFPVQLLESAGNLVISAVLFSLLKKSQENKALQGKLLYVYLLLYSVLRFFDEFLRGDIARGYVGPLSTSQIISLVLVGVSITALLSGRFKLGQVEKIKS